MNPKLSLLALIFLGVCGVLYAGAKAKKKTGRKPEASGVDELFVDRWSPRAMSGEGISDQELMPLFEAARWAPSSYNEQPWRFIYAHRATPEWGTLFNLLVPFNQEWCKNGAVLVVIVSKKTSSRGTLNECHTFDTGSAWENLALQGSLKGLVVHGIAGFDYEKAKTALVIPDDYQVEAMCVIGKPGDISVLPKELQSREKPSTRKPLHEIVSQGTFSFKE